MEIKSETYYFVEKSLTTVEVKFIYAQTEEWVSFFGSHYSADGIEIGYPRMMNLYKQYLNVNWKEVK